MPRRFERRLGAALVALALAASALTGLAQAVARFGPAAHAAAPTGCDRRHGVSGYVTDDHGAPVRDAPVLLLARREPPRMKVGRRVGSTRLGFTHTDGSGCYAITLKADHALMASVRSGGLLDMTMTIQVGRTVEMVGITRQVTVRDGHLLLGGAGAAGLAVRRLRRR